jgi:F-type H+-transporting ATPase subunit delta
MASKRSINLLAQRLTALSIEDGAVSSARVAEVLSAIGQMPLARRRSLLPVYRRKIKRALAASKMTLESPEPMSEEAKTELLETFSRLYNRRLTLEEKSAPELIGGFRLRVGDDVYEKSIRSSLQAFLTTQIS